MANAAPAGRVLYIPSNRAHASALNDSEFDPRAERPVQPGVVFGLLEGEVVLQGRCGYCGLWHPRLTRDHIIARAVGGVDKDENYLYCCPSCNSLRGMLPLRSFIGSPAHVRRLRKIYGPGFKSMSPRTLSAIEQAVRRAEKLPRRKLRKDSSHRELFQRFDAWLSTLPDGTFVSAALVARALKLKEPGKQLPVNFTHRTRVVNAKAPCWEAGRPEQTRATGSAGLSRTALHATDLLRPGTAVCALCGCSQGLAPHRIFSAVLGGAPTSANLMQVCNSCSRLRGALPLQSFVHSPVHRARLKEVWGPQARGLSTRALQRIEQRVRLANSARHSVPLEMESSARRALLTLGQQWSRWCARLEEGAVANAYDFYARFGIRSKSQQKLAQRHLAFGFVVRKSFSAN